MEINDIWDFKTSSEDDGKLVSDEKRQQYMKRYFRSIRPGITSADPKAEVLRYKNPLDMTLAELELHATADHPGEALLDESDFRTIDSYRQYMQEAVDQEDKVTLANKLLSAIHSFFGGPAHTKHFNLHGRGDAGHTHIGLDTPEGQAAQERYDVYQDSVRPTPPTK